MSEFGFDHDRLDVYRLSIEYTADAFRVCRSLDGLHRHARDQWLRAAQSIPLNVAEGNGKRSLRDRARFLDIARGSALECAAIQDVFLASDGIAIEVNQELRKKLTRIVAMLTRMAMKFEELSEPQMEYVVTCEPEFVFSPPARARAQRSGARARASEPYLLRLNLHMTMTDRDDYRPLIKYTANRLPR